MDKEQVVKKALQSEDGEYLLPRRYGVPHLGMGTTMDRTYEACAELVNEGRAEWISSYSNNAPGILVFR